jgi:aldose 1-epimerase
MGRPRELVLRSESLEVVILPALGGRIHRIRAFGHDLLRTPREPEAHASDPFFWGAYPMAPWANRAPAGVRELAGRRLALRPNFVDGTAIHGLVYADPWETVADETLAIRHGGDGGAWPWAFELTLAAAVEHDSLVLDYRLVNRSAEPMPAGIGLHPWFRRPMEVRVPSERVYTTNIGSPRDPAPVAGTHDLRTLGRPADGLDATWAGVSPARVELAWPRDGVTAELEIGATGEPLVAIASPPSIDAVAIEPQTHGPDPLRRLERGEPDAPALLGGGDELRLVLTLTVARAQNLQ